MACFIVADACARSAVDQYGYGLTVIDDWIRLPQSLFAHSAPIHLVLNVLYLLTVGYFVEPMIGALRTVVTLVLCHMAGALTLVAFAEPGILESGSSNAIHGLLACGYVACTRRTPDPVVRAVCGCGLVYFTFMVVYAIYTGRMPWPVGFFVNCGWGHLGGIAAGVFLGMSLSLRRR